jgi:hypothetical protein
MTKNSSFLRFRDVFVSYYPQFWGFVEIYKEYDSLYILERNAKKSRRFCVYGHFRELLLTVFGSRGDLQGPWHSVYFWEAGPRTHHFYILGLFSWAIAHNFGVPWTFTRNMIIRGMIKKLIVFAFMGVFVSYCPQFWGSGWFTRSMTLCTFLQGMTKNLSFLHLWMFPWAIVHSFAIPWRFTRNMIVCTF